MKAEMRGAFKVGVKVLKVCCRGWGFEFLLKM